MTFLNPFKEVLSSIHATMKLRPLWVKIMYLVIFIYFFSVIIFPWIAIWSMDLVFYIWDNIPSSSRPFVDTYATTTFFIYIILLISWFKFAKNKSFKKFIYNAIPFVVVGVVLYFFFDATGWIKLLYDGWIEYPELSNLSAILAYTEALVRIVVVLAIYFVFRPYIKKLNK